MLHILLMILKIIGIILLAILGILILLLLVVLFVPLRYQIEAEFPGDIKKTKFKVKCSWLLHLFSGKFSYLDGETKYQIRVFWKKWNGEEVEEDSASKKTPRKKEPDMKIKEVLFNAKCFPMTNGNLLSLILKNMLIQKLV